MTTAPDFIIPTWSMRAKFAASLALFVAWGASHQYWLIPLAESLHCANPCQRLVELRAVAIYLSLLPLPLALWLASTAQRIRASGQVPPPCAWQLVRTRIRRGWQASVAAFIYAALGFIAAGSIGVIAHALGLSYIFCIAEPCGCL